MKIVIDARMYQESGVGRYIRNLVEQLKKLDRKNEYLILTLGEVNIKWYTLAEQIKLPKILNQIRPDLVHFPHFNVPIFYKGKFVVTIHDLIHQHFAMIRSTTHDPITYKIKQLGYKTVFKHAINKSAKILVPSNFVREQLINEWSINPRKITVTPEAVEGNLKTGQKKSPGNYIFYVGNAHPHKNVEGLIRAFLQVKARYKDLKLVLSGYDHYFWRIIKNKYQQKDIIYTGFVSDEKLVKLYNNALCFVMPSFEEGFGIPILEAMACGCPVVSSNAGALPEVGGDAVVYFDPTKPDDMVEKITQVLDNINLRKELIEKGKKRVKAFSWEKLAKKTLEVYNQCE